LKGEGKPARKLHQTNKPMIDNKAISVRPAHLSGRRALIIKKILAASPQRKSRQRFIHK
jgi:hypothetical protein